MTLRFLLGWLGAQAPIHEADIRAVGDYHHNSGIRRVLQFLDARGMVIADRPGAARRGRPARSRSAHRQPARPFPVELR